MTPNQFLGLLTRPAGGGRPPDRLAELTRYNDDRGRRGLVPVLPSWMTNG